MRRGLIAILAFLSSGAAIAQGAPRPAGDEPAEIVVRGRSQDKQVREFIGALTRVPPGEQIRQFVSDVCPASFGLSDSQNAAVVRRMRRIASTAGIPLAKETCDPNVIVIATEAKDAFLAELRGRYPHLIERMPTREREALKKASGPATAFLFEDLIGPMGESLRRGMNDPIPVLASPEAASRLKPLERPVFAGAIVLFDLQALNGTSTSQVADYAALRGFARTEPARAATSGTRTILSLFDDRAAGRAPPASLTQWDLNFLKALYATSNDAPGSYQRAAMAQRFKKNLKRAEEADVEARKSEDRDP